jgi:hypothetical protein
MRALLSSKAKVKIENQKSKTPQKNPNLQSKNSVITVKIDIVNKCHKIYWNFPKKRKIITD